MERKTLSVPRARFIVAAVLTLGTAVSATSGSLGFAAALATAVLATASVANAQATVAVLHSFTGQPTDGAEPVAGMIQGPDGTLYGTTSNGGGSGLCGSGCGTVFKLAPDGSGYNVLHSFTRAPTDGAFPYAGLTQGPDGTLYGTTVNGGANDRGTIFHVAPDGSGFTVLHNFTGPPTDGDFPYAALIPGPDGTLYGTTASGGATDHGTIFHIAPDGSGFTVLHSFTGTDGNDPWAGLTQGPDGTLYGTTYYGGTESCFGGCGTVFKLAPDGSGFTVLHSFAGRWTDGENPRASLIQGPDGTLYGTTDGQNSTPCGDSATGTIFRIAPDGSGFAVLHSFDFPDFIGIEPISSLIQRPDGTLYGTTSGGGTADQGTIFQMAPDGTGFTVLHSFTGGGTDGAFPFAGLTQGPDGTLYGTASGFGTNNLGVVFQLTLSPSAPTSGRVGHK